MRQSTCSTLPILFLPCPLLPPAREANLLNKFDRFSTRQSPASMEHWRLPGALGTKIARGWRSVATRAANNTFFSYGLPFILLVLGGTAVLAEIRSVNYSPQAASLHNVRLPKNGGGLNSLDEDIEVASRPFLSPPLTLHRRCRKGCRPSMIMKWSQFHGRVNSAFMKTIYGALIIIVRIRNGL